MIYGIFAFLAYPIGIYVGRRKNVLRTSKEAIAQSACSPFMVFCWVHIAVLVCELLESYGIHVAGSLWFPAAFSFVAGAPAGFLLGFVLGGLITWDVERRKERDENDCSS